jgi:hypothetical protein
MLCGSSSTTDRRYQWDRPFTMDSTLTERTFGLAPTDLDAALASVAAAA